MLLPRSFLRGMQTLRVLSAAVPQGAAPRESNLGVRRRGLWGRLQRRHQLRPERRPQWARRLDGRHHGGQGAQFLLRESLNDVKGRTNVVQHGLRGVAIFPQVRMRRCAWWIVYGAQTPAPLLQAMTGATDMSSVMRCLLALQMLRLVENTSYWRDNPFAKDIDWADAVDDQV